VYSHGHVRIAGVRAKRVRRRTIRMLKIAILGFGREGKSVFQFLQKRGLTRINTQIDADKKPEIWILDKNPKFKLPDTINRMGIKIQAGKNYLKGLNQFNVVYRSPGVPYNLPEIQAYEKRASAFGSGNANAPTRILTSATALFFNEAEKIGCKVIGITGTKGKGTTATLLYKILKACNKPVYLAGNIGKPAIELLSKISINQRESLPAGRQEYKSVSPIIILELSSFQLQDLKKSPDIAVILDIFPDHLDAHKNLSEYFDAKTNIAKYQKKSDKIFYFADNKYSKWIAQKSQAKKYPVDSRHSHTFADLHYGLKIAGEHNFKNAVMAATVALSLGCQREKIVKVVKNFKGNEHRLELTRVIRINQSYPHKSVSIRFYNDSASTNPQTAAAAIRAFKEPKILIAGGKDKGLNYFPLAKALKNSNTKLVILFGENKNKIAKAITRIKNNELRIMEVKNLKQAVEAAYRTAKSLIHNSYFIIHVIFSPASASFDMFKDYADRGEKFKKLVKELKH